MTFTINSICAQGQLLGMTISPTNPTTADSITDCPTACEENIDCVAFMYGNGDHPIMNKCLLSNTRIPNASWNSADLIFCASNGKLACCSSFSNTN